MYKKFKKKLWIGLVIMLFYASFSFALDYDESPVELNITAENSFTDPIRAVTDKQNRENIPGRLNISIVGNSFSGTVTLQRQYLDAVESGPFEDAWLDVKTYTANDEEYLEEVSRAVIYRIGVKTGDFSGTSVAVRLSRK
jgi:hypothetical protein